MTISQFNNFKDKADKVPNPTDGNLLKTDSEGNPIDTGISASIININRIYWAYQDFNAGAITGTSITLNSTSYSNVSFDASKIINSAFIVRSDNLKKYVYTGATALFSSKIKINSISSSSVTLSGTPHSSYPIRIYYQYNSGITPINYTPPINTITASALDELNPIIATQEEVDSKLSITNNLNDVNNRQTALDYLTNVSSGTPNQVLLKDSNNNAVFGNAPSPSGLISGSLSKIMIGYLNSSITVTGVNKIYFTTSGNYIDNEPSNSAISLSNGGFFVKAGYDVELDGFAKVWNGKRYMTFRWYRGTTVIQNTWGADTTSSDTDASTGSGRSAIAVYRNTTDGYFYLYRTGGYYGTQNIYSGNTAIASSIITIKAYKT